MSQAEKPSKAPVTVACQIGKHKLCDGTGNLGPHIGGERVECGCPCHSLRAA